ncbi:alpha/beta hydrolase [Novosphingobium sp. TH158]|uniref:alpha/beta hydrolase n=1 Tax=Novosphingobium sp. TH158 TaxID=2067455 RepID=UPI000C7CB71B|nr:alpha/beta hydrolase [Novosphingobium sp. TH158]PLK25781.1 lipase [Novosphingobium sp. TH158]
MTEHFVRPDVRAFLDMMKANPRPPMSDELVAMMRALPPGAIPSLDVEVGELSTIRDLEMPGPGGNLPLRLFDVRAEREAGPVVVYYHGGGFAAGSIDSHAAVCADMSRALDLPVVSVEYRLAPENPWPAAPDDAEAAARWVAENGKAFGREAAALVLAGDSAGGNLAAVTAIALRDRPAAVPVQFQLLIYPVTDSHQRHPSRDTFAEGFFLSGSDMAYFDKAYAADNAHWRASPARGDLTGLPPALVVTAGLDPLRDEGREYARLLETAGVAVQLMEADGTIHGFCSYRQHIPSARDDYSQALELANAMLAEAAG